MGSTIRDVARLAGVGNGTVSRVLNGSARVSPATRARVLAAIAELDFVPSSVARQLSTGRSGAIGAVVPFLTRPSVVERLRGIASALAQTTYDLVAFNIESLERRSAVLDLIARSGRVDGLVIVSLFPKADELDRLARSRVPTVLVDGHHRLFSRVVVDDVAGGRAAGAHLVSLGHRRIAFIGDDPLSRFQLSPSRLRRRGLAEALAVVGAAFEAGHVRTGGTSETAREVAHELLAQPHRPTAIVCGSDTEALGVLEAARDLGIEVPDRLSVVGYDDIEVAAYARLTTVAQPLYESGRRGAQLLLQQMDAPNQRTTREVLPTRLVIRKTTAPPWPDG